LTLLELCDPDAAPALGGASERSLDLEELHDGALAKSGALQLPFVVSLEEHRADQPNNRGFVTEDADDIGPD
jgi:hypothetical protein